MVNKVPCIKTNEDISRWCQEGDRGGEYALRGEERRRKTCRMGEMEEEKINKKYIGEGQSKRNIHQRKPENRKEVKEGTRGKDRDGDSTE